MIAIPAGARVLLATSLVGFRKGAHGLAALASELLREDPFSGAVLVFRSKRADGVKIAVISHDTSERLDVIPARLQVSVTRRPKLACRTRAGVVVQAPTPPRLVEGGSLTETAVAHVLVAQ